MVINGSDSRFNEQDIKGRWSEEEYLLREAKHRSDIDPNDESDIPRSYSDRDVCQKRTRNMGTRKYLKESCYHRIEYSIANSLTALIRK